MKKKYEPDGGTYTYEPLGGKHLNDVAKVVTGLVKRLGVEIDLNFCGVLVTVAPGDKPSEIVKRYHNRRKRPRRQKRKSRG